MLNFMHLESLRAVLETGSLSGAGKKLGYTTSAVSQQIAALERSLGVQLFERGPRNLWPTAAARQVDEASETLLSRIAEFEDVVRAAARSERGRLSIASFSSTGARLVPRALAELIRRFPAADFPMSEYEQVEEIIEAVSSMRADLGLIFTHPYQPVSLPDRLVSVPVLDEEVVVLAGAGRSAKLAATLALESLANEVWVSHHAAAAGRVNLEYWGGVAGFRPKVMFETESNDAIRGLVREGVALALAPALALGVDRGITMHRLTDVNPRRQVHLIYRDTDKNPLLPEAERMILASADHFIAWTHEGFDTDELRVPLAARI
ncbi:LysR family transcriptional regulator [Leucobacter sp. GX24907]